MSPTFLPHPRIPTQHPTHPHSIPNTRHSWCTAPPSQQPVPAYCRTLCFANNREQATYYSPLPIRPKNGTRPAGDDVPYNRFEKPPKKYSSQKSPVVKSYKQSKGQEVANQGRYSSVHTTLPPFHLFLSVCIRCVRCPPSLCNCTLTRSKLPTILPLILTCATRSD